MPYNDQTTISHRFKTVVPFKTIIPIYLPLLLSVLLQHNPILSYLISWSGSFFIFYISLFSKVRFISCDVPLKDQIMRPIALTQIIFAGFMCCTSFFYFMDHLGYAYLRDLDPYFQSNAQTRLIAKCQRLALLAHAALVTGMILQIKPFPAVKYHYKTDQFLLIKLGIGFYLAALLMNITTEFIQFKYTLTSLSISCSAYIFIHGLIYKKALSVVFGCTAFGINFLNTTLTGYKESIIINLIILMAIAFPYYRKTILFLFIPCIYLAIYILPTFTMVIRSQSWFGGKTNTVAREQAYQTFFDAHNDEQIAGNNWDFLTNRFSETGMFTSYVRQVPDQHPYYGLHILENSMYALVPKAFWKEKPSTEQIAMERVYQLGIVNRASAASAKTRPVTDCYLMAGPMGIFLGLLLYGMVTQWLCNTAERLFGGYQMGCIIIFNSLFQQLWRGNTSEFLINTIFYSYVLMQFLHFILRRLKILQTGHL
ncbi:exosortase Y-associated Wzy-like protein [Pedobacter metabolipauper]|uniref:Oligosaccharide repeat unit polymerase n=1 Tax=Pedobacter metabolipauper TaxID=425513 RepID=A0A4R6SWV4_9SPHI|nr:hypothetical protein [Pedobacter metabolipauper]TDQ08632.1 hypothetical protein ATK78_3148 [Pedobacter metabolipauper]